MPDEFITCPECGTRYPASGMGGFSGMCPRCLIAGVSGDVLLPDEADDRQVGNYHLEERIGVGGMGTVWRATQSEPVRREVAVKIIKLGMDTEEVVARFENERQALAAMDHPNIAVVFDAGATPEGRPYFVMELIKGEPIVSFCQRHKLALTARLRLFLQLCSAVEHAHQKGIIHRDLKPSNVLVAGPAGEPVVKVIDFGVAKATGQHDFGCTMFTQAGQMIGTPAYMSPEQAGATADIDVRSDVYALGVLFYEILVGRPPFEDRVLKTAMIEESRRIIREVDPPRPSTVAGQPGSVRPHDLAGDLDWITMKALEKDRERRYGSAAAFGEDIRRFFDNEPVTAAAPSAIYRSRKFCRKYRRFLLAVAAVVVALGVGGVMALQQAKRAERAEEDATRKAVAEAASARIALSEAEKSRRVTAFLSEMLQGVAPSVALGEDTKMLRTVLDRTRQRLEAGDIDRPEVEAELRVILSRVYLDLADYAAAEEMARAALDLQKGEPGGESLEHAEALGLIGRALRGRGRLEEAAEALRQVIAIRRRIQGSRHRDTAEALNNLGRILYQQQRLDEAATMFGESIRILRELGDDSSVSFATQVHNVGSVLHAQGHYPEAEARYREALAIWKKIPGDQAGVAKALISLASVLRSQGKLDEAEKVGLEAVGTTRRIYGPEHPQLATALTTLAYVYVMKEDYARASTMHQEVLGILRKSLGDDHPKVTSAIGNVGFSFQKLGKHEEAEVHLREALRRKIARYGDQDRRTMVAHINLARALCATGGLAEAEELARHAMALGEGLPQRHPDWGKPIDMLGYVMLEKGEFGEAEKHYRRLHEVYAATGHPGLPMARSNLASALREQGKAAEADALEAQDE